MTRKRHKSYDMSQLVLFKGKHTVQTAHCALWLSCGMRFVQGSSFKISPPADEEEHDADPDVGEHDTHPDLHGQRVHEGENTGAHLWKMLMSTSMAKKATFTGCLIIIEMPSDIKGLVKSATWRKSSNGIHIYLSNNAKVRPAPSDC